MRISIVLQLLLVLIAGYIIKSKDNLKLVIAYSAFSLIAACLYFLYKAPDVALAEIAVGSAIIPLIFILSISKQKEFIVINHLKDDFMDNTDTHTGVGYIILSDFCRLYDLKLKIYHNLDGDIKGIFKVKNVDLIVDRHHLSKKCLFKGKESSILMNKLEKLTAEYDEIKVIKIEEGETDEQ
ncbi:MAG: Na(+)/H(+) antiporter subunit B [Bacillota bacterium]